MKIIWAKKETANRRYETCKQCDQLSSILKRCKQCGCFMKIKTKMLNQECPLGKWKSPINSWN